MKITVGLNEVQFDQLNKKLIWIQEQMAQARREYGELKLSQRLAAIEADVNVLKGVGQELLGGQDKLLQSHAALEKKIDEMQEGLLIWMGHQNKALQAIQGALLHQQFKSGKQKVRRRK